MTLIVEIGFGSASAESYCSVAEASAYHATRGNAAWDALDLEAQEQALRAASDYMVGEYRLRWAGVRANADQALDWPRHLVPKRDVAQCSYYPSDAVPVEVKRACASLALRASSGTLQKDQTQRKASVTIGPITTVYEPGGKVATTYAEVDAMLRPLLSTGAGQIRLVRR